MFARLNRSAERSAISFRRLSNYRVRAAAVESSSAARSAPATSDCRHAPPPLPSSIASEHPATPRPSRTDRHRDFFRPPFQWRQRGSARGGLGSICLSDERDHIISVASLSAPSSVSQPSIWTTNAAPPRRVKNLYIASARLYTARRRYQHPITDACNSSRPSRVRSRTPPARDLPLIFNLLMRRR